ncbi:MAG TPA: hypothetical protein VF719_12250, partial [Abditibacteriaceae bacterium]
MSPEFQRLDSPSELSQDFSVSPSSAPVPPARWGWAYGIVPPALLLGLAMGVQPPAPGPNALAPAAVPQREYIANNREPQQQPAVLAGLLNNGVLPLSQTMLVTATSSAPSTGGNVLRARLQSRGSVRGRAPLTGQVARVMVRVGQQVEVNDRIIEISTGPTSRAPRGSEAKQARAESAQVAAVNQQTKLQQQVRVAQFRLVAAQARVAAAQQRVEAAREIVEKLQRGEAVTLDAPPRKPAARRERRAPSQNPQQVAAASAHAEATREAERAASAARRAEARATVAEKSAAELENTAKQKAKKLEEVRAAAEKVQKLFDSGAVKASDVDVARASVEEAEAESKAAADKAQSARKNATVLMAEARSARDKSQTASTSAARAQEKLQAVAGNSTQRTTENQTDDTAPDADERRAMTIMQAAKMVRSAVAESDSAVAEARRIKAAVDRYEKLARTTRERLDESSKGLEAAQEQILDQTIQANLSVFRAPATGTVLSVAPIAQEVSEGDTIVTIGRGGALGARLLDFSGVWRKVQSGARIPVQVGENGASRGITVMARVRSVEAPSRSGEAAAINIAVPQRVGTTQLDEGTVITYAAGGIVGAGSTRVVSVPGSSVLPEANGQGVVAVLQPLQESDVVGAANGSAQTGGVPQNAEAANAGAPFRIEWRKVTLGPLGAAGYEVRNGLQAGERIATQP